MRHVIAVLFLLALAASPSEAQTVIHEYRPEIILTLPRVHGYGVTLLYEQHLEQETLAPNERIQGVGLVSPELHGVDAAFELRQVHLNGNVEHRYIPTIHAHVPLFAGFMLRDRARVEMRDIAGTWSRRYQNRSAVGHNVGVAGRALWPYVQFDMSYDTRFNTLNRREETIGVRLPIVTGTSLDTFITRQADTRRNPLLLIAGGVIARIAL